MFCKVCDWDVFCFWPRELRCSTCLILEQRRLKEKANDVLSVIRDRCSFDCREVDQDCRHRKVILAASYSYAASNVAGRDV